MKLRPHMWPFLDSCKSRAFTTLSDSLIIWYRGDGLSYDDHIAGCDASFTIGGIRHIRKMKFWLRLLPLLVLSKLPTALSQLAGSNATSNETHFTVQYGRRHS